MPSAVHLHDGEHEITVTFRAEQDRERFKAHYRALDAAGVQYREERDALAARCAALEERVGVLTGALEWYADEKHWTDEGVAVTAYWPGGWRGADYQDADYSTDNGDTARAALAAPPVAAATGEGE